MITQLVGRQWKVEDTITVRDSAFQAEFKNLNYKCWSSLCPVGLKTVGGGSDPLPVLSTVNIGQSVVSMFAPCNWFIWRVIISVLQLHVRQNPAARSKVATVTETSRCLFVSSSIKSQLAPLYQALSGLALILQL